MHAADILGPILGWFIYFDISTISYFFNSAAFLTRTSPNNSASKDIALRHEDKTRNLNYRNYTLSLED